jgi:hypothetical protein
VVGVAKDTNCSSRQGRNTGLSVKALSVGKALQSCVRHAPHS